MTYRGHIRNGVVVLDDQPALPEGAKVSVELLAGPEEVSSGDEGPTLLERLRPIVGAAKGLPADASTNVDHYLYGHPKR
jgi:hypothetical protein